MRNPYTRLRELLAAPPLQVGTVTDTSAGTATIELPDGSHIQARGAANIGDNVYVRGDLIEATAPALSIVTVEV